MPELPPHIRVDADDDGPVGYRNRPSPRLRIVRRSELLSSAFMSVVVAMMALGGGLFASVRNGSTPATIVFVILLVFVLYGAIAKMTNHTIIELESGRLRVRHGPLPWPGAVDMPASEIVQIFCDVMHRTRGSIDHFRLHALLRNGERRMLLPVLGTGSEAQLLEDLIETRLGIADAPVES